MSDTTDAGAAKAAAAKEFISGLLDSGVLRPTRITDVGVALITDSGNAEALKSVGIETVDHGDEAKKVFGLGDNEVLVSIPDVAKTLGKTSQELKQELETSLPNPAPKSIISEPNTAANEVTQAGKRTIVQDLVARKLLYPRKLLYRSTKIANFLVANSSAADILDIIGVNTIDNSSIKRSYGISDNDILVTRESLERAVGRDWLKEILPTTAAVRGA